MKKFVSLVLVLVIFACSFAFFTSATEANDFPLIAYGTVKVSSINVRAGAGTDSTIIGGLTKDKFVFITGDAKDSGGDLWYRVNYQGQDGYVLAGNIDRREDMAAGTVIPNSLNVRSAPEYDDNRIGGLQKGDYVFIVNSDTNNGEQWFTICYEGKAAFVLGSQIDYHERFMTMPKATTKTVGYRTDVTVNVTVRNVPKDHHLRLGDMNTNPATADCSEMSIGTRFENIKGSEEIKASVINKEGAALRGYESVLTVKADDSFGAKISWFFRFVFGGFRNPTETVDFV